MNNKIIKNFLFTLALICATTVPVSTVFTAAEEFVEPQGYTIDDLKRAISCKNTGLIIHIIQSSPGLVNQVDKDGATPLWLACFDGNFELAKLLLANKAQASVNRANLIDGRTPLWLACCNYNFKLAQLLLEYGADINQIEPDGETPLLTACKYGYQDLVLFLLKHGADPRINLNLFTRYLIRITTLIEGMLTFAKDSKINDIQALDLYESLAKEREQGFFSPQPSMVRTHATLNNHKIAMYIDTCKRLHSFPKIQADPDHWWLIERTKTELLRIQNSSIPTKE